MKYFNRDQMFPQGFQGVLSELPEQAIPSAKKDMNWKKANMDALSVIAQRQVRDNLKFRDYDRMAQGKVSYLELKDVLPSSADKSWEELLSDSVPSQIKNYDIMGVITNAFVGKLPSLLGKYTVDSTDSIEINEYEYAKTSLLVESMRQKWEILINNRMLDMGIDPNLSDFQSDEERQQYEEFIRSTKEEITPEDVETYMTRSWKSAGCLFGKETIENDRERFSIDIKFQNIFENYLKSGRGFFHVRQFYDGYCPEEWDKVETFYSRSLDVKYPQYGEYMGRRTFMDASNIIRNWGHLMTAKEKQQLIGGHTAGEYIGTGVGSTGMSKRASVLNMYGSQTVPFDGWDDYRSAKTQEAILGIPTATNHFIGSDGQMKSVPSFLPDFRKSPGGMYNAKLMSDDPLLRNNLNTVTEAYWVSYKRVFFVSYQSESGLVEQTMVTDELFLDFLKENGIKKVKRALVEEESELEINTYFEEYIPEIRYGVKVESGNLNAEPLYLDCNPIRAQVRTDDGLFNHVIPVSGIIGNSLFDRIRPYQAIFNLAMNQLTNYMAKEIGTFFMFDVGMLPSEYKNQGDIEDQLMMMHDTAKNLGLVGIDASRTNTQSVFNQFSAYDMSLGKSMQTRISIAEYAWNKALATIGITPQAMGQQSSYESATGIKEGINSFSMQTAGIYSEFDQFVKNCYQLLLDTAQQCCAEGKDTTIFYTKSDSSRQFIKINNDDVKLRNLGIRVVSNSNARRELEDLKNMLLRSNTLGMDILDFAKIIRSDSFVELMEIAQQSRRHNDKMAMQQQQSQQQMQQQAIQNEERVDQREHKQELEVESLKSRTKIGVAEIQAQGQAARSQDPDSQSQKYITDTAKINSARIKNQDDKEIREKELALKKENIDNDKEIRMKELQLKTRDLNERSKRTQALNTQSVMRPKGR